MNIAMGMLWGIVASLAFGFDLAWGIAGGVLVGYFWEKYFESEEKDD